MRLYREISSLSKPARHKIALTSDPSAFLHSQDPVQTFRRGATNPTHRNRELPQQPASSALALNDDAARYVIMANPLKLVPIHPEVTPGVVASAAYAAGRR